MSISLYEHNERAYRSALDMLQENGKAAVIHPTGTGKFFIGFKFCEDFPDKTVCWLSPSEYNMAHMKRMIALVPDWFSLIDNEPHIYRAYSPDPATREEFERFRSDRSVHLKLLFTIEMLNEAIHVKDVDGVILFRPTVSPIIYKQQIGRALRGGAAGAAAEISGYKTVGSCSSV